MRKLLNRVISAALAGILVLTAIPVTTVSAGNGQTNTNDLNLAAYYDMSYSGTKLVNQADPGELEAELVGFTDTDFIEDESKTVLNFTGNSDKYIKLPQGLVTDEPFTIQTTFFTSKKQDHWLFCLGTKIGSWPNVTNYIFLNPLQGSGTMRTGIKDSANERLFDQTYQIDTTRYNTVTMVFDNGSIDLYLNGEFKQTLDHGYDVSEIIQNGITDDIIGYIGKSTYSPDPAFSGKLASFAVYHKALTAKEVYDTSEEVADQESQMDTYYDMTHSNGVLVNQANPGELDAELVGFTDSDFIEDDANTVLNFTGDSNKYVKLPEGLVTEEPFTIQTTFFTDTKKDHWLFCLGTKVGSWPDVTNYIFLNPLQGNGTMRTGIKDSEEEKLFAQNYQIDTAKYNTVTMVFNNGSIDLYLNGKFKETLNHGYDISEIIQKGTTDDYIGYIGRSTYALDPAFTGKLASFAVYNKALSPEEIYDTSDEGKVSAAKNDLVLPYKDDVYVHGNITLPEETENGVKIEWATDHPDIIDLEQHNNDDIGYDPTPAGTVTRPAADTLVTMTTTLTAGDITDTKTFEFTVKAAAHPVTEADYKGYLFAYFAGEAYSDGEQIYFGSSEDGLNWKDLNDNEPVLTSTLGEQGVRDPYIIRSAEGDKFYMIATDLKIYDGNGWGVAQTAGSQSLMVWESNDLVNWSKQRMVKIALDTAGCTWAPEATYDELTGEYIVYWASKVSTDSYGKQRVYYAKTRDFYTFTEPQVYIEKENHVIDTTIIKHEDTYYRYSKDETTKNVRADSVPTLLSSNVTSIAAPVLEAQSGVEGPAIFKLIEENKWCLLVDNYGGIGYYPLLTTDLASGDFEKPTTGFKMPSRARHGTVIQVTEEEYNAITAKWGEGGGITDLEEPEVQGPILEYNFENGTAMTDSIGGNDGTLSGNAKVEEDTAKESKVLYLDGTTDTYASFPTGFFDGRSTMTISMDVKSQMDNENFFTLSIGKNATKYMFLRTRPNEVRNVITTGAWSSEQGVSLTPAESIKNKWINIKLVLTPTTMKMYVDGELVSENSEINTSITDFGKDVIGYLGKSFYSGDKYFNGAFDNIKVYNRVLTEKEIADEHGISLSTIRGISADDCAIIKSDINSDDKSIVLYVNRNNSVDLDQVALDFKLLDGVALSADTPATFDLTKQAKITLEIPDNGSSTKEEWIIDAVLCNNPVLGGEYADPDIDYFNGKYYIYPTSDGFTSWSGTEFHVFSSEDLVDWTDEGVIVDVAANTSGEAGVNAKGVQIASVPWAIGSAWAPSIEEKNGTYYFYFCAKRADGQSCIGVATADQPEGPFVAEEQPLITPETCSDAGVSMWQTIDPSIFTDDDGRSYVLFGNGYAAIVELNDDMVRLKSGTLQSYSGVTDFREAITVTKRNGMYHFTWSCDDTGSENYHINYGTSASLYGPIDFQYTVLQKDTSNNILGTGHHSIVQGPGEDEYYIAYHRFVTPIGKYSSGLGYHRETCIDKVEFDAVTGLMNPITPTLGVAGSQSLDAKKAAAVNELEKYNESVLYSDGNEILVDNARAVGKTTIANAATADRVTTALNNAKAAIGGIQTLAEQSLALEADVTIVMNAAKVLAGGEYTTSIALPVTENGSVLQWSSNQVGVVDFTTGNITRQSNDTEVKITAVVVDSVDESIKKTVEFTIMVPKRQSSGGGSSTATTEAPTTEATTEAPTAAKTEPAITVKKTTKKTSNQVILTVEKGHTAYYSIDGASYKKYSKAVSLPVGKHKVTVYTVDPDGNKSKSKVINVTVNKPKATAAQINTKVKKSTQIKLANVDCASKITYKSTNSKVVKVTQKGKITALKAGKANIKVTVTIGGKKTEIVVKVVVKK